MEKKKKNKKEKQNEDSGVQGREEEERRGGMPRRPRKHARKKVKLKVKKNKKNIRCDDPEIRQRWDSSLSPLQNYRNLG